MDQDYVDAIQIIATALHQVVNDHRMPLVHRYSSIRILADVAEYLEKQQYAKSV